MTPIEVAVKAAVRHAWKGSGVVDGDALAESGNFDPKYSEEVRAIITAFLVAAAGDEDTLRAIRVSGVSEGRLGIFERDIKGIILALLDAS